MLRVKMNEEKLKEAQSFYDERIKGWMLEDLEKSIEATTNFLTALGCLVYTEVIGNFFPELGDKETGSTQERKFYRCLYRTKSASYLKSIDNHLRKETNNKGLYLHLRHNLCHRYYPSVMKRHNNGFVFFETIVARDGYKMGYPQKVASPPIFIDDKGRIAIATRNYTNELKEVVDYAYKKTFLEKEKSWQDSAIKGIDFLHRGVVNSINVSNKNL